MGLIGILLDWARRARNGVPYSEGVINPGAGKNATGSHFGPPGDDGQPLPGDYVIAVETHGSGRVVLVGYSDPKNEAKAEPGERRIYARNSDGDPVVDLFLKADGSATLANEKGRYELRADGSTKISNDAGNIELKADGSVSINGATITADGEIVNASGINLSTHVHGGVTSGSSTTTGAQ